MTDAVRVELERVVRRWQQLPLDHALAASPAMRELTQQLADAVRAERELDAVPVPDLGPATLLDQLRVMAYDAQRLGLAGALGLADRLAELRRTL